MRSTRPLTLISAITLLLASAAHGQTLTLDRNIGAAPDGPPRGASMQEVTARFGEPEQRSGPVGDPPITVWHYPGFKVYFEHQRVLHATSRKDAGSPNG